jgi:hypothetical protein
MSMITFNWKKILNYILGPILLLWLVWSIYHQIIQQPNLKIALQQMQQNMFSIKGWQLLLTILLVFANWGIESRKYQLLVQTLQPLSFSQSFKAILSGISFAISTPNRMGEYAGRMVHLNEGNRIKSLGYTMLGSLAQLVVTFCMGLLALVYIYFNISHAVLNQSNLSANLILLFIFTTTAGFITLLLLYYNIHWLEKMCLHIKPLRRFAGYWGAVKKDATSLQHRILWLSFCRFGVFLFQYVLVLNFFGIYNNFLEISSLVSLLFLFLACIPTLVFAELGIRGQLSVFIFGYISTNTVGLVAAALTIWLLNLILPALAGSLLLLNVKWFNKTDIK